MPIGFDCSFKWFDLWIGAYWDGKHRTLYLCPLPMVVIEIRWKQETEVEAKDSKFWESHQRSKEAHNKKVASLPFSEKVEMTERLQADCELLEEARERDQFGLGQIPDVNEMGLKAKDTGDKEGKDA